MRIKKLTKREAIVLAVILAVAVGAFYLWRDLHLGAMKNVPLPDIIVEDIEIERVVNGKTWIIISPRAEHKEGVIYGTSVDITIKDPNGRNTHIYADGSTFTRENNDITLTNGDGTMTEKGKTYDMQSGFVEYDADTERWNFSKGVTLSSENMVISGDAGVYDTRSGDCYITNGGTVTWTNYKSAARIPAPRCAWPYAFCLYLLPQLSPQRRRRLRRSRTTAYLCRGTRASSPCPTASRSRPRQTKRRL